MNKEQKIIDMYSDLKIHEIDINIYWTEEEKTSLIEKIETIRSEYQYNYISIHEALKKLLEIA